MNWIVMAIMAVSVVSLTALALFMAKKEDDELADMKRRIEKLEMNNKEDKQ